MPVWISGRHTARRPYDRTMSALQAWQSYDDAGYRRLSAALGSPWDEHLSWLARSSNHSILALSGAGAVAVFGGARGRRAVALSVVAVSVSVAASTLGLKRWIARERPRRPETHHAHGEGATAVPMPETGSFPSAHSASAAALATTMTLEWPAVAFPFVMLAGLVGYSRLHAGVHFPSDVVGGMAIGSVSAILTVSGYRLFTSQVFDY
jgi:membrane-associated phospholipid phosphatase